MMNVNEKGGGTTQRSLVDQRIGEINELFVAVDECVFFVC